MARELWVGPSEQYGSVRDAAAAAEHGDTIYVRAGVYENDFAIIRDQVSIIGVGGQAHFKATESPPNGKAIFTTTDDTVIENLAFSGTRVRDGNGAGIRHEGGDLTVRNSYFEDNQNGILTVSDASMRVLIEGSEFAGNGAGDGYTHGIYVNRVANLTVRDSYFHETPVGHLLKSRAAETVIENSRFEDGPDGTASRQIDLPNGGQAVIRDSVLYKAADASQGDMIGFGLEGNLHGNNVLRIEGATFESDRASGPTRAVRNSSATMVEFEGGNTFEGVEVLATGPHEVESDPGTEPGTDPDPGTEPGSPPAANDDALQLPEGGTSGNLTLGLLANDTGDGTLTVAAVDTSGTTGTVQFDAATQTLTYAADEADFGALGAGQTDTDSFTYTASDGTTTDTATVEVEVQGQNDAPGVGAEVPDQSAEVDQSFSYAVPSDAFRDPDAPDTLTLAATGLPDGLSLQGNTITGTPQSAGTFTVEVSATDPHGAAAEQAFSLLVEPAVIEPQEPEEPEEPQNPQDPDEPQDLPPLFSEAGDKIDLAQVTPGEVDPATTMEALGGNDYVSLGASFNEVYRDETFGAGSGSDVVVGRNLDDRVDGGAGSDMLLGGTGDDFLIGGPAQGGDIDILVGSFGRDTLVGSGGDARMVGGRDADVFLFGADADGDDRLEDFKSWEQDTIRLADVLDPGGDAIAGFADLDSDGSGAVDGQDAHATQSGADLVLDFQFGSVAVANVSSLVASDFDIAATNGTA